jgi:hypothetical protein
MTDPDLIEFSKMMEEELEKAHPSYSDGPTNEVEPLSERDQERLNQFATEFDEELQGKDNRKMMFVMDIAIHTGETPKQLRQLIDEKGIEAAYQVRMSIHLAAKDLGVTYREAGKIVSANIWGC